MEYMLLLYVDQTRWPQLTKAEQERGMAAYMDYIEALAKAGALVSTNRLGPSSAATTLRKADGKQQVLDGPYTDTKEQLGGYYFITAADLDAALSWAARCPAVEHGVVEVRPLWA